MGVVRHWGRSQWADALFPWTVSVEKSLSLPHNILLPAFPRECATPMSISKAALQRTAVGRGGQESLEFIPPGAQGFEQTSSGDTLKLLVIQLLQGS